MSNNFSAQRGVSLVITFMIMTIILGVVLSISVMLNSEIKITANIGNSVSSLYAAQSGAEKTLYFDRKQIPLGARRGICSICATCAGEECVNCLATPLGTDGCRPQVCNNCKVTYSSEFNGRIYEVSATVTPDGLLSLFTIQAKGFYKNTSRAIELNSSQLQEP